MEFEGIPGMGLVIQLYTSHSSLSMGGDSTQATEEASLSVDLGCGQAGAWQLADST